MAIKGEKRNSNRKRRKKTKNKAKIVKEDIIPVSRLNNQQWSITSEMICPIQPSHHPPQPRI
jgi:hypothetical protein